MQQPLVHVAVQQRLHLARVHAKGAHDAFDDAVSVLFGDMKRHAAITQISRQHVGWKARLLLVEIDRDEVETKRGTIFERKQDIEERVAVLTARQAHHDAVARFDHREIADRLADEPP